MVRDGAMWTVMDYKRIAPEEVETRLFGGARGRQHGGF